MDTGTLFTNHIIIRLRLRLLVSDFIEKNDDYHTNDVAIT